VSKSDSVHEADAPAPLEVFSVNTFPSTMIVHVIARSSSNPLTGGRRRDLHQSRHRDLLGPRPFLLLLRRRVLLTRTAADIPGLAAEL
jgi:hypothetical protein